MVLNEFTGENVIPLETFEKSDFSRGFHPLFNRIYRLSARFSAGFSTPCREWENSLLQEHFFSFSTKGSEFIHRLFHNLWKTFLKEDAGLSYLSYFF